MVLQVMESATQATHVRSHTHTLAGRHIHAYSPAKSTPVLHMNDITVKFLVGLGRMEGNVVEHCSVKGKTLVKSLPASVTLLPKLLDIPQRSPPAKHPWCSGRLTHPASAARFLLASFSGGFLLHYMNA